MVININQSVDYIFIFIIQRLSETAASVVRNKGQENCLIRTGKIPVIIILEACDLFNETVAAAPVPLSVSVQI